MRGRRRRAWESAKTVLILLLTCSAVYLASRTLFSRQLSQFLSSRSQAQESSGSTALSGQTLRPAALCVSGEDKRYAVLYDQDDPEAYAQVSALLAEALGSASQPRDISQRGWEQALLSPGLYCEYLGPLPLDDLSRWLSGSENRNLADAWAQRLCVTGQNLCYLDRDGAYHACYLSADLSAALTELSGGLSSNGARFAGETEDYGALRWDTPVLPVAPAMPALAVEDPIAVTDALTPSDGLAQALRALSFHPQTNPLYAITGGWAINDGGETLRIDPSGALTYRRSEGEAHFAASGSALDTTRALAESALGSLCGDARLYLRDVRETESGLVISYGYAYRGAAIQVEREGWCAQFTVKGGQVESFTLKPRRYTAGTPTPLLPQEQAAAALQGTEAQSLLLLYEDDGLTQTLTPFWGVQTGEVP